MEGNRLKIFADKLNEIKQRFLEIINNTDEKKGDKFEEMKKIVDECNIFESYNIEYLKLLQLIEKEKDFKSNLKKYEGSISLKSMDKAFPKIYDKISSLDKIKNLIYRIINFERMQIKEKEKELKKLFDEIKSEKLYNLNFQLLPSDNMELYLYNLYQIFERCIYAKIKEYKNNELTEYINKEDEKYDFQMTIEIGKMIDELNEYKEREKKINKMEKDKEIKKDNQIEKDDEIEKNNQIEKYKEIEKDNQIEKEEKSNVIEKELINEEDEEMEIGEIIEDFNSKIKSKEEELTVFQIAHGRNFEIYIKRFSEFYFALKDHLDIRFFQKEEISINDIQLFEQFIYTLSNYDFDKMDDSFIEIWKESLIEKPITEIKKNIEELNKAYKSTKINFKIINNNQDLQMNYYGKIFIINNIQKYSFDALISYLIGRQNKNKIDNFELIKYLKIQYFSDFIHETILGNKWKDFLYEVFKSNTIQSLIHSVHKDTEKISEEEYKKLIDSVKFFNFHTSNIGQSYPLYNIFISGIISVKEREPLEQIRYYARLLIIFMHEILGHVIIFIIKSLYDKTIKSPETKGKEYSKVANIRGRESGEYLHVQLFGKLLNKITPKELCFIFNTDNYSENDYKIFTQKFLKCNDEKIVKPKILIDLLNKININKISDIPLGIYPSKENIEFSFNIIEENEIICRKIDFEDFDENNLI